MSQLILCYPASIVKKFVVISGRKLCFNHLIYKGKRQILRALGVVFYLSTGAQKSGQHVMSEPTFHNVKDNLLLSVGWSHSTAKGHHIALSRLRGETCLALSGVFWLFTVNEGQRQVKSCKYYRKNFSFVCSHYRFCSSHLSKHTGSCCDVRRIKT